MENLITGVDIGGTHITVCLVDISMGKAHNDTLVRAHIDTSMNKEDTIAAWSEIIRKAHRVSGIDINKIGIAMPGPFNYEEGISYIKGLHKYETLYGVNVKKLLAEGLDISPSNIRFVNDASAYLLGEVRSGAGRSFNHVVGITLGTGLGSAVFQNGSLHEGDLYRTDFLENKCEDFLAARWIIHEYGKLAGKSADNVKQIADICPHDDNAKTVFEQFGKNLFNVLRHRYSDERPQAVVVGGNIAKAWDHFIPSAIQEMETTSCRFRFKKAELGEEAALTGAAFLWQ